MWAETTASTTPGRLEPVVKSWTPAAILNTQRGGGGGQSDAPGESIACVTPPSLLRGKAGVLPPSLKVYEGGYVRTTYRT